jgi:hypothetical protein
VDSHEIPKKRLSSCIQIHAQEYVARNGAESVSEGEKRLSQPTLIRCIFSVTLIVLVISTIPSCSHEVAPGQFVTADNSVNNAFSSVYYAEQNGGDVSALIEKLNAAVFLIQKAGAENATNPNAATTDLSNATRIAQMVSLTSASVSSSGSTARQLRFYESLGTIVATLVVATLAYLRGDRVYRLLWLYVYKNHLVKKTDE